MLFLSQWNGHWSLLLSTLHLEATKLVLASSCFCCMNRFHHLRTDALSLKSASVPNWPNRRFFLVRLHQQKWQPYASVAYRTPTPSSPPAACENGIRRRRRQYSQFFFVPDILIPQGQSTLNWRAFFPRFLLPCYFFLPQLRTLGIREKRMGENQIRKWQNTIVVPTLMNWTCAKDSQKQGHTWCYG